MNIPKEAIEKAIEGGWKPNAHNEGIDWRGVIQPWQATACDPSFWQSLGKALGWTERIDGGLKYENGFYKKLPVEQWYAHKFYDLILTGGDTEVFWKELLSSEAAQIPTSK